MRPEVAVPCVFAVLLAGLLGGCGQMGPLSLPEPDPAPAIASGAATTAGGPTGPASPADEDEEADALSVDASNGGASNGDAGNERPE